MKHKCDHCHGKGGCWVKRLMIEYFRPCFQCKGRGSWHPNKRPKRKPRAA